MNGLDLFLLALFVVLWVYFAWQLGNAFTKGKIFSRIGFVHIQTNPALFLWRAIISMTGFFVVTYFLIDVVARTIR